MSNQVRHLRKASPGDARLVAEHRARMFHDMGRLAGDEVARFVTEAIPAIERVLTAGTYHAWFMMQEETQIIGGAGLLRRPLLPRPEVRHGDEGVILNVFVEPSFRRQGVARVLMQTVLDWCRVEGIERIVLHPSAEGRPLYESMGFVPTSEMVYRPN